MTCNNDAKAYPLFFFYPSDLARNNLMYQSKNHISSESGFMWGANRTLLSYLRIKMTLISVGERLSSLNEAGM